MTVREMTEKLKLEVAQNEGMDNEILGGYQGDLLSWVMANLQSQNVWITIQGHINIIAVASLKEASCIILAEGSEAADATIEKAKDEEIPILYSKKTSFEVARDLIEFGI